MDNEITTKDIKILLLRIYKKYKNGSISEKQANKETYILNSVLKAIEVSDFEDRLHRIEQLMLSKND